MEDENEVLRAELALALARYAEVLQARLDVIPELIMGSSVGDIEASLVVAQAAYARLAERFKADASRPITQVDPFSVSSGGGERHAATTELNSLDKIAAGFVQRSRGQFS